MCLSAHHASTRQHPVTNIVWLQVVARDDPTDGAVGVEDDHMTQHQGLEHGVEDPQDGVVIDGNCRRVEVGGEVNVHVQLCLRQREIFHIFRKVEVLFHFDEVLKRDHPRGRSRGLTRVRKDVV